MSSTAPDRGDEVTYEIALTITPGMKAAEIDRLLAEAIGPELHAAAEALGVVLDAHPARYAKPLPSKDAAGRTRYAIKARREGERLVAAHRPTRR